MKYYRIFNKDKNTIGFITSLDFRYYNAKNKRILCCQEAEAQYVYVDNFIYRINMLNTESEEIRGRYPEAFISLATEEEYQQYRAEIEKELLEEK